LLRVAWLLWFSEQMMTHVLDGQLARGRFWRSGRRVGPPTSGCCARWPASPTALL